MCFTGVTVPLLPVPLLPVRLLPVPLLPVLLLPDEAEDVEADVVAVEEVEDVADESAEVSCSFEEEAAVALLDTTV